ncbi:MAG: hypothetical protein NC192_09960, partial [Muribaculaceae bacterium]|nr:hypothetical protein [Muribaculaceae bacterium]
MKKAFKKIIASALAAAVMLTLAPLMISASAATTKLTVWNGTADTSWFTGKKDSYNISTAEQLAGLAKIVNNGKDLAGITFNLTRDVWLNSKKDIENIADWENNPPKRIWDPIGYSWKSTFKPFNGIFNGNGHTIHGMCASSGETTGWRSVGLFGYVYCAGITSVKLQDCYVYASSYYKTTCAGGIAGIAEGSVINQCEVDTGYIRAYGPKSAEYGMHEASAGGIVGYSGVENANGVLAALTVEAILGAGGLIANPGLFNDGTSPIKSSGIYNCMSNCDLYASGISGSNVGGIIGDGQQGYIKNCISISWRYKGGNVYGNHLRWGLIAGQ